MKAGTVSSTTVQWTRAELIIAITLILKRPQSSHTCPMDQYNNKEDDKKATKHKKWVPRPLVTVCGVCGSPATDVHHYGATSCYSCRAFFRRSIGNGKEYRYCSRKTDTCVVDAVSRTNCKKCRFQKCLQVGMKPEKVDRVRKKANIIKTEVKEEIADIIEQGEEFTLFHETKRRTSESSHDSNTSIDISALVEECILEEEKVPDYGHYLNNALPVTLDEGEASGILKNEEEKFKEESDDLCDNRTQSVIVRSTPVFNLTFEEDFKIHELLVRRENLFDATFQSLMDQPDFLQYWEQFLISVNSKNCVLKGFAPGARMADLFRKFAISNFMNGGVIRQSLDMFDEYKNVDESVKTETVFFSMSVFFLCIRSILIGNKNKGTFVNQHRASGTFTHSFQKACLAVFPDTIHMVGSFDPRNVLQFTSPWAAKFEDEVFFSRTTEAVGNIIKDDINLGTLYCTLLLATPGMNLSRAAQTNPALQKVQREMSVLIYRYLTQKCGNSSFASATTTALIKLLADLHICREIHLFGRLNSSSLESLGEKIEDLEF